MTTCGDNDHIRDRNDPLFGLNGKSLEEKRLETLMTATGFIRGSFVRKLLDYSWQKTSFELENGVLLQLLTT